MAGAYEFRNGKAAGAYRRGIDLAPLETLGYLRLGGMLRAQGEAAAAAAELETAVRRIETSAELRYQLALAYAAAGRIERAIAEADAAGRLDPQSAEIRRLMEWLESKR